MCPVLQGLLALVEEDYVYKMSGCETLHLGEAHRKQGNSSFG